MIRCETEDGCARLCGGCARLTAPKAALLDWAVNLMADGAQEEKANRMGTRNLLTALSHPVQHMNFLNMLVERVLKHHHHPSLSSSASVLVKAAPVTN